MGRRVGRRRKKEGTGVKKFSGSLTGIERDERAKNPIIIITT
jgi:hypothetical protein